MKLTISEAVDILFGCGELINGVYTPTNAPSNAEVYSMQVLKDRLSKNLKFMEDIQLAKSSEDIRRLYFHVNHPGLGV